MTDDPHMRMFIGAICCVVAIVGCDGRGAERRTGSVTVLAASSTKDAVEEIARRFRDETGIEVKVSPGGSSALAGQILAGAPAHLFLAASNEWAVKVRDAGLAESVTPLLSNRLVLIVPRGNPAGIRAPADLRMAWRVALAGESVPAGVYAEQALRAASLFDALAGENRLARGHDVRVALGYVETAEADAGIVYATDARLSDRVEVAYTFDPATHEPIVYPLVLLKTDNAAARRFHEFILSARGRAVFERHGFIAPTTP